MECEAADEYPGGCSEIGGDDWVFDEFYKGGGGGEKVIHICLVVWEFDIEMEIGIDDGEEV